MSSTDSDRLARSAGVPDPHDIGALPKASVDGPMEAQVHVTGLRRHAEVEITRQSETGVGVQAGLHAACQKPKSEWGDGNTT